MWFMPYVRVRRAVAIYASLVIGITLVAIALRYWPGVVNFDGRHQSQFDTVRITFSMLLTASVALVGGFATVLGLNLAAENDGHLELAWTKPVSREGYALGVFAVDLLAMALSIAVTSVCAGIIADVYLGHQAITIASVSDLLEGLAYCGFPVCIYAWVTALSASLKRNRGSVAGIIWPLMIAVAAIGIIPIHAVHVIATVLNTFNPIEIYTTNSNGPAPSIATYLSGWAIAALLLAAAVVQWRRMEI